MAEPPPVVLVFGGTGYVGQFVVQALLQCGPSVAAVHVAHRAGRDVSWLPEVVRRHVADLSDPASTAAVLREVQPNVVVNCAAMSALGACEKDPGGAEAANCPRHLAEALAAQGAPRLLVHFSTDIVFGGEAGKVYDESCQPDPVNTYGRLKAAFDGYLLERSEPLCVVLRPSNILGPPHPYMSTGTKFLQWLESQMRADTGTKLFEDELRSFVWVDDLVALVMRLIEDFPQKIPPHRLFHCGGPQALTRPELARWLAEAQGLPLTYQSSGGEGAEQLPKILPTPRASVDLGYSSPLCVRMDSSRAESLLGRPFRSIEECIKDSSAKL